MKLYTVEDIADLASLDRKTVERLIGAGHLRARNISSGTKGGKRWRITEADFTEWIESCPTNTDGTAA